MTTELTQRYQGDKPLLHLNRTKLIIPGWAGELDDVEAAYVAEQLNADRKLWLAWRRAGHFKRVRRHVSPDIVKNMALVLAPKGIDSDFQATLALGGIMKQPVYGETDGSDAKLLIMKHPGRPRVTRDVSRTTAWRREKEGQGALI